MKLRAISEDQPPSKLTPESYLNPDYFHSTASTVPFIFMSYKGERLFTGQADDTHYNIISDHPQFQEIFNQLMTRDEIKAKYTPRYMPSLFRELLDRNDARGICNYLLGRVGTDEEVILDAPPGFPTRLIVSFWDNDKLAYELLDSCLTALEERKYVKRPYYISTPIHGTVPVDNITSTKEMTPEESEQYELQKRLHLMRGAEKQAAMKQLGLGGQKPPHKMQQNLQRAGLLVPGQKWRAPYSESK